MSHTLKRFWSISWNCKMHKWQNCGADRVFVNLENAFLDRGGLYKILVCPLKMRAEVGASFLFVRLQTGLAKIVSHTPQYVQPCHIKHRRIIGDAKKAKVVLSGGKLRQLFKHSHISSPVGCAWNSQYRWRAGRSPTTLLS